jgi:hypothetical protein
MVHENNPYVSWPLREKVLVALIVVLEIFVWSSFPRWLRE